MAKSELLPCPFCGGNDVHVGWTDFDSGVIFVECESCGMHCEPKDCYANEPKAIAAWNTRVETKAERDLRDEVNWMHSELHGAEMAASGETVLLDEQYSHAMCLVEELHQVLSLNGGVPR